MKQSLSFIRENKMGIFLLVGIIAWVTIGAVTGGCPMCAAAEWLGS